MSEMSALGAALPFLVVEHPLGTRAERGNDGFHGILSMFLSLIVITATPP